MDTPLSDREEDAVPPELAHLTDEEIEELELKEAEEEGSEDGMDDLIDNLN